MLKAEVKFEWNDIDFKDVIDTCHSCGGKLKKVNDKIVCPKCKIEFNFDNEK